MPTATRTNRSFLVGDPESALSESPPIWREVHARRHGRCAAGRDGPLDATGAGSTSSAHRRMPAGSPCSGSRLASCNASVSAAASRTGKRRRTGSQRASRKETAGLARINRMFTTASAGQGNGEILPQTQRVRTTTQWSRKRRDGTPVELLQFPGEHCRILPNSMEGTQGAALNRESSGLGEPDKDHGAERVKQRGARARGMDPGGEMGMDQLCQSRRIDAE